MPDLSALLSKPAGEAKKPPLLPVGNYPCIIKSYEACESKKKTQGLRFTLTPTSWPDDIEDSDKEGIDLSKKNMRHDVWITEDSMYIFDSFLRDTLKLELTGRQYEEVVPETVGCELMAMVVHTQGSRGDDLAVIDKVGPLE